MGIKLLLVGLGGGLGAALRLILFTALATPQPLIPWATLTVNLLGSFCLALLFQLNLSPAWLLFLGPGVMGGFTTYSTFNQETLQLIQGGNSGRALLNVGLTLLVCLLGGLLGGWAGRR